LPTQLETGARAAKNLLAAGLAWRNVIFEKELEDPTQVA
jgi:hypothetical protein